MTGLFRRIAHGNSEILTGDRRFVKLPPKTLGRWPSRPRFRGGLYLATNGNELGVKMGYLDLIGELRAGKADLQKAEKAMKALGWLCIVGGLWNYAMYFGIRYLGRLPVKDDPYSSGRYRVMGATQAPLAPRLRESATTEATYKDSRSPFGVTGTFVLLLAVPMGLVAATAWLGGLEYIPYVFPPVFLVVFCAPIAYNYVSSRFENGRTRLASYTGGGSIFMFNASWPFFRLLVYEDGVEVRVEFHRFFIPYASMGELPVKAGFFTRAILIASDLPGVPSKIRFGGFGMKRIVATVGEARAKWLARHNSRPHERSSFK